MNTVSIIFTVLGIVLYVGAKVAERILRNKNKKNDEVDVNGK